MEKEWKQIPYHQWAYAACDNPDCLEHNATMDGTKDPNRVIPIYSNGTMALCETCWEQWFLTPITKKPKKTSTKR